MTEDEDEVDIEARYDPSYSYPTVEEIIDIHGDIIEDDPNAEPGLKNRGDLEYAIDHIEHGHFGEGPETLHEKAYQLMRLIAANHPFVDGNKRTALATTVYFYFWNGYELEYQAELEAMLILISIREDFINPETAVEYLEGIAEEFEIGHVLNLFEGLDLLTEVAENMGNESEEEDGRSP
ncbi:type II toxin-antitoxin system death-on-curing family toxin [Halorussus salilacus]|uniref:type II toxin-antitoxin system death-on-curing family toxin n=1 Tax=Halorussus salilacus TaxID=2953750 RepID=UPI0020A1A2FA|nr:type II toxin-antitoxin system death-on-curing family toxin [Halorussus salilacus]USZ67045.1 type II toxin-antitoxin system death-on-curing family toxin [Halorussus salilacus]